MKKIKLHGIGNNEKSNYYIFDKKQEVVEVLSKLLYDILKLRLDLYEEKINRKTVVRKDIDFEKLNDEHDSIWSIGKKEGANVFYGDKKIFLIIYCSNKLRIKFNQALEEISLMPKGKKFKPIEK